MFLEFLVTKMRQLGNEIRLYRSVCNGYIHKATFRDENISVPLQMNAKSRMFLFPTDFIPTIRAPYLMDIRKPFFGIKKQKV
jgi:hypothetical protein